MAFKYRLSISIALIVTAVLVGFSLMLHADFEEDALVRIKAQLTVAQERVMALIEERQADLDGLAAAAGRNEAVHHLLADPVLQATVRDNMVEK